MWWIRYDAKLGDVIQEMAALKVEMARQQAEIAKLTSKLEQLNIELKASIDKQKEEMVAMKRSDGNSTDWLKS